MPGKWTGGTADANDARLMTSGTLAIVVNATTQEVALPKGLALITNTASPSIPTAGTMRLYGDSTSGVLTVIDGSTGRSSTAIGITPSTSQWLKTFDATTGGFTAQQPAFTDISGVIAGSQLPAFTGDVTKPLGSVVQTLANIPNDVPAAGDILFTGITLPSAPGVGTARVFVDSTSLALRTKGPTAPSTTSTAFAFPATSHQWIDSFSSATGQFTSSQPAFTDISGVITAGQLPAFTGDVTKPLGSTVQTLANIPNDTPAAGDILFANTAAPATPGAGTNRVWTNSQLLCKNDVGTISSTAQAKASVASQWLNSFSTATGQFTTAQPAFTDLTGSIAGSQLPAFTGDVTKPAGSTVQTLANIPTSTPAAGTIVFTQQAAAGTPSAGTTVVWGDNTTGHLRSRAPSGVFYSTAQSATATASQWLNSFTPATGAFTQTQPAFTDISGSVAGSQLPAFTGDVTKPSGSTVQTLVNIPNDTTLPGDILATNFATPASPAAGKVRIWANGGLFAINSVGQQSAAAFTQSAVSNQWLKSFDSTSGSFTTTQPTFSDISSTLLASQYTFGITLAHMTFGYTGSTPGPLIGTGSTTWLRNDQQSPGLNQVIQWRCPIALADIEAYLEVDTWNDGGSGGNYTLTLMKNGSTTANTVNVTSTGIKQLTGGPVTFSAGDLYGFKITCGGTVGVRTDFTLYARGKTV